MSSRQQRTRILTQRSRGFGSISYGYNASIIGTTLGQPSFIKYMKLDTLPNATDLISSTNGLFQTGGVVGTLIMPWIADKWGRKWGCAVPCMLLIISGAVMTGSVNIGMFLAFRFFSGAGSFMILAVVPILMNEIVPVSLRGALVDVHGVMLVLGYTIQGWVGFGFFFWNGGANTWRPPMALTMVWPLILLVGLPFLPESPRWLCMQGRDAEAEQILIKLHRDPRDPENVVAAAEFYQIQKQMQIDRTLGSSWLHIIRKPSYRKRALLAIGTCGIVQCSGVLVINSRSPVACHGGAVLTPVPRLRADTLQRLGFQPSPTTWLTFAWGMNALAMLLVDRFPRPKYMAFGVLGCMSTLIVEAALVATYLGTNNKSALLACVAMFFVFQVFYALCLDGTQFSYLGEVFPTHIRAKGICLGVAMISLMNIMWLQSAPIAFINIGWKFYLALIIPGSIGGVLMFLYFPDTNGVPLEEVAAIFGDADEVAVYERDLDFDPTTHAVIDAHSGEKGGIKHLEAGL
ncbi:hypothetical protein LTR91_010225 [Friedmanniomyces endolithicus]|uniref:Major facilitator superfamily (MFS) profile domain-containing protein n=2 Tax=Dothideomycetidae TaxID=451867 RepID=A0AAN6KJX3_9PEZI|nr:hypothetical protein LTS00_011869 [Friedmanniomyces endolithicus]KAK0314464.1 hypothetical protein LTR01_001287 [Friedmanniomyces endolithicus]KAK0318345.1 hypothetical protein LTR82_010733 [Friedmanniomyces endolithicus]KAK0986510.1 hypothetical protein LTR91_010225 [Friedmanniomyces endolithicus]KAK1008039.1 hypothetical protein LTS01_002537 [Friedmanniomyces endolithicus]